MTSRRLSAFLDAVAAGRRPRRVKARPEDVRLMRTAIDLRAARPEAGDPDERFVTDLHRRLQEQMTARTRPAPLPPARRSSARLALAGVAASAALVVGTVAVVETVSQAPSPPGVTQVPHGDALRTGTFVSADNQVLGQIVAYRGDPSWVFMKVTVPHYNGRITCELQAADGSVLTYGSFPVRNGIGQFSKRIRVEVTALRGARLVTSTGSRVASATFA